MVESERDGKPLPAREGLHSAEAEESVHLSEYLAILRRRWRTVAWVTAGLVFITGVVSYLSPRVFEAVVTVQIGRERPMGAFGDFEMFSQMSRQSELIASELEIVRSRRTAEEVVRELDLRVVVEDAPEEGGYRLTGLTAQDDYEGWLSIRIEDDDGRFLVHDRREGEVLGGGRPGEKLTLGRLSFVVESDRPREGDELDFRVLKFQAAVGRLRQRMVARPKGRTNVILIKVQAGDPVEAADTANAIAATYIESTAARKTLQATATREFLSEQLVRLGGRLQKAERSLSDYKKTTGMVTLSQDAERILEPWTENEIERGKLDAARQEAEALVEMLTEPREEGDGPIIVSTSGIPNPVLADLAGRLTELELHRAQLAEGHQPGHPRMRVLEAELAQARRKVLSELRATLEALREREASLGDVIQGYQDELRLLPEKELGFVELLRESKVNQELYTIMKQRLADAEITEASTVGYAWTVDDALPPAFASWPRTRFNVVLAFVLGLVGSVGLVFLLEYMDRSVRSAQQLERHVGLPTFGIVPEFSARRPRFAPLRPTEERRRASGRGSMLISESMAGGHEAEAYRSLRTNIRFACPDSRSPCFLVTSSVPGEGKSLTCANLGISLAGGGQRVLIVDADLRRPTQHGLFELPRHPGLSQALTSSEEWRDRVRKTSVSGLDLLTAGEIPPNPADLLASNRMRELLREFVSAYDVVLVDSPPVLPFTDASVLSSEVDGVFLVVWGAVTSIDAVDRSAKLLQGLGARVFGTILNRISFEEGFGIGGQSSYYYYYYYDSSEEERTARGARRVLLRLRRRWSTWWSERVLRRRERVGGGKGSGERDEHLEASDGGGRGSGGSGSPTGGDASSSSGSGSGSGASRKGASRASSSLPPRKRRGKGKRRSRSRR